jgi:hypothetical protein
VKPPAFAPEARELRRAGWIVAASYFAIGLADPNAGLWQLPLQWLLKEQMRLSAEDVAWFFAAALTPWYFKPLAGLLSDALPIFGSRRRAYLLVGASAATLASAAFAFAPPGRVWLLACAISLHVALMLVSTVTGGYLVEAGQRWIATGKLTSWRSFAESTAALCVGPLGGWLAGMHLGLPAGISAGLALSLLAVFAVHLGQEEPVAAAPRGIRSVLLVPIAALLRSRGVWIATALLCCYQVAPGFQTPLFFLQTNTLHFTPHFIGTLGLLSAAGSLVGAVVYAWCCRRIRFRWLFPAAVIVGVAVTLSFLEYRSTAAALTIETLNGIGATFAFVALLDLIARAMPKGREALGYAFVFSVGNVASSVSDILGSRWFDGDMPFSRLVWLNASTTSIILAVMLLLPKRLMRDTNAVSETP